MKIMRNMLVLLAVGALAAGSAFGDYASLVNVNFVGTDAGVTTGAAGTGAAGDQWNNVSGDYEIGQDGLSLLDSTGAASDIDVVVDTWEAGVSSGSPVALFTGYGHTGRSATSGDWGVYTLSGLDVAKTYDIYLYSTWGWNTDTATFKIGTEQKQGSNPTGNRSTFVENENYVVFSSVSPDASGNLAVEYSKLANTAFNGMQIGAIPEPGTLGMVGLCGGAILFVRRRFMI